MKHDLSSRRRLLAVIAVLFFAILALRFGPTMRARGLWKDALAEADASTELQIFKIQAESRLQNERSYASPTSPLDGLAGAAQAMQAQEAGMRLAQMQARLPNAYRERRNRIAMRFLDDGELRSVRDHYPELAELINEELADRARAARESEQ